MGKKDTNNKETRVFHKPSRYKYEVVNYWNLFIFSNKKYIYFK